MSDLSNILVPIQSDVDELEKVMLGLLDSQVPFVKSVAEYVIQNGGKRLRPLLTILSARLCGFEGPAAFKMGSCIEFIHTASLLHDDVIDNAKIRRGRASANHKWGNHVSVLVGDFFYCRASQLLTEQNNFRILKTVTDSITALTEGEVLEITTNAEYSTTQDEYLKIIENKTAVLFAAACQVGGILAKVPLELELGLRNYGFHLGVAFQLADDILDYTAAESVLGKKSGIDLQEGKLTLPLIIAKNCATPKEAQIIHQALTSPELESNQIKNIIALIQKYNGFDKTLDLAKNHIESAKLGLASFKSSKEKDILVAIANYVFDRKFQNPMPTYYKIQTYLPESHLEIIKEKLNAVITPLFDHYDFVFSWYPVFGSWRSLEGAKPYLGKLNQIEVAPEIKLECTLLKENLSLVFDTLKAHHPYEKPVIEAFEVFLAPP